MLLMPLYTVADAPLCCLEVLLTGKADTPYRVKALFPQGFYPILTIVRLYSNNRSPILKRSFAYRQTIGLKFSRGSMGVAKGQQKLVLNFSDVRFKTIKQAVARVEQLLPLVDDTTPRTDPNSIELELLSNLVADYSEEHFSIGKPCLGDVIKMRMPSWVSPRQNWPRSWASVLLFYFPISESTYIFPR